MSRRSRRGRASCRRAPRRRRGARSRSSVIHSSRPARRWRPLAVVGRRQARVLRPASGSPRSKTYAAERLVVVALGPRRAHRRQRQRAVVAEPRGHGARRLDPAPVGRAPQRPRWPRPRPGACARHGSRSPVTRHGCSKPSIPPARATASSALEHGGRRARSKRRSRLAVVGPRRTAARPRAAAPPPCRTPAAGRRPTPARRRADAAARARGDGLATGEQDGQAAGPPRRGRGARRRRARPRSPKANVTASRNAGSGVTGDAAVVSRRRCSRQPAAARVDVGGARVDDVVGVARADRGAAARRRRTCAGPRRSPRSRRCARRSASSTPRITARVGGSSRSSPRMSREEAGRQQQRAAEDHERAVDAPRARARGPRRARR